MTQTLREIHQLIGGELIGNAEELITGVNALEYAQPGELTFADHQRYLADVRQTRASAILVPEDFPPVPHKNLLRVARPRVALVRVMALFHTRSTRTPGLHPTAVISPQATLGPAVSVGEGAVIRAGATIGRGTIIEAGVYIDSGVCVGEDCYLGPHVVVREGTRLGARVSIHSGSVIGDEGFGYVWAEGRHVKIPQLGNVIIEDDVEIGTNVCVDRAMFGSTIIRRGTKIDNLVQIAHNDVIGEDVIMTGQVGLAGSVTVGNRVMFGARSGAIDHVRIGDDARLGSGTIAIKDVKPREVVWGFAAHRGSEAKREMASLSRLPHLLREFRKLFARFTRLESHMTDLERSKDTTPRERQSSM